MPRLSLRASYTQGATDYCYFIALHGSWDAAPQLKGAETPELLRRRMRSRRQAARGSELRRTHRALCSLRCISKRSTVLWIHRRATLHCFAPASDLAQDEHTHIYIYIAGGSRLPSERDYLACTRAALACFARCTRDMYTAVWMGASCATSQTTSAAESPSLLSSMVLTM